MGINFDASPEIFKKAEELRNRETVAEKLLWKQLSGNKLGVKFRRQHPLKWFITDFYCHKAQLIIELDGGIHLSHSQKEYDECRELELKALGLKVLRFTNEEVCQNMDKVLETIKEILS